jgi:hypothetical protein
VIEGAADAKVVERREILAETEVVGGVVGREYLEPGVCLERPTQSAGPIDEVDAAGLSSEEDDRVQDHPVDQPVERGAAGVVVDLLEDVRSPRFHSTNLNGPVPIGFLLYSAC